MQQILFSIDKYKFDEPVKFRNYRDELISKLVDGINKHRLGTTYKPVNKKYISIRVNKNPFLKSNDELELLLKDCEKKGNFAKFFWITK